MTPKPKTPSASGISRLLAAAGFRRSEREIGGYGSGFVAERTEGAVRVRHRFWSMGGGNAEDHNIDPSWTASASDGAIHGKRDGLHNCTWACDYDLPHPGDSPFRQYADPALASRVERGGRSGPR